MNVELGSSGHERLRGIAARQPSHRRDHHHGRASSPIVV